MGNDSVGDRFASHPIRSGTDFKINPILLDHFTSMHLVELCPFSARAIQLFTTAPPSTGAVSAADC